MFPRRILRIPSNKDGGVQPGRNGLITPYDPFSFNTMPFGLKNAGATYQRMIQTCLEKQIGKTVEAYIDDVVIKTRHVETLIDDLRLTFDNL